MKTRFSFNIVLGGLLFLAGTQLTWAEETTPVPAPVAANLCYRSQADFQTLAYDVASRISMHNQGGAFNGGVCWWHSRLQRSAVYLTMFRPDLPKPTRAQGHAIISSLSHMRQVIVIPGYADFNEFSRDYEREILARLESWQREDGLIHFRWIDGLKGHWRTSPARLKYIMSRIHRMVAIEHRIVFEKLALPGLQAHAWLVLGSTQTVDGFVLDVVDSNRPQETLHIPYHEGDRSLSLPYNHKSLVPYLDFDQDLSRISSTVSRYCGNQEPD